MTRRKGNDDVSRTLNLWKDFYALRFDVFFFFVRYTIRFFASMLAIYSADIETGNRHRLSFQLSTDVDGPSSISVQFFMTSNFNGCRQGSSHCRQAVESDFISSS